MPGGQGFNAGQGSVNAARAVLLRSNKNVTSVSVQLNGQSVGVPQGTFSTARARLLSGINLASAQHSFGGLSEPEWNVGAVSVMAGQSGQAAGQFNVAATLPAGYTAGGVFRVDVSGNSLPTGMTLSEAGVADVGSASIGTQSGVLFAYAEPGALPTLTLHSTSAGSFLPYMATVYPPEGVVPAGQILVSPDDDPSFRSSVLSTWADGSAKVIVGAGHKASVNANSTASVRLRPGLPSSPALTTAHIDSLLTSIEVDFGATIALTDFTNGHDFVWWANTQVICARYRLPIGNKGVMEAVIDVHAFALGRVFVEVVIENSKMVTSAASKPANQSYTGATVSVNGSVIATASSSEWAPSLGGTAGVHQAFVAWYCSGWVGGDPGIEVTHDTASMQSHPMFYEVTAATSQNLQTLYQSDAYSRFGFGRHRSGDMGAPADHESIGPLPLWEARYLQSGDKHARRAVLASAQSLLTFAINFRDSGTGLVPTHTQLAGKSAALGFPNGGTDGAASGVWEPAHQPAATLMAFLCRPSPCFIELAQKIAAQNHITQYDGTGRYGYWFETRGKAWAWRNLAQAIFVTPDSMAFKAPAAAMMTTNVSFFREWDASAEDKLNVLWELTTSGSGENQGSLYFDHSGNVADGVPFQFAVWMHHFLAPELFKAHEAKLLTGADQTSLAALVDWALLQPVRWVNEQANGGWRYIGYRTTIGTADGSNSTTIGQLADWGLMRAHRNPTNPSTVNGAWFTQGGNDPTTYATGWTQENGNSGLIYVAPFWTSICAAVERGVSGAETAWATIEANVTNLTTFKNHGAVDPRHHAFPRNK